jgi:CopG antitoxin of type II toxin-antitoxin system
VKTTSELSQSAARGKTKKSGTKIITAEELDRKFNAGEDVSEYFDFAKATRPGLKITHTTLDLPAPFMEALDRAAARRGVTRQSLIKMWLYQQLSTEEK